MEGKSVTSWLQKHSFPSSIADELAELGIQKVSDFSRMNSKTLLITMDQYILNLPLFKQNEILQIRFKAAVFDLIKNSPLLSYEPLQNHS